LKDASDGKLTVNGKLFHTFTSSSAKKTTPDIATVRWFIWQIPGSAPGIEQPPRAVFDQKAGTKFIERKENRFIPFPDELCRLAVRGEMWLECVLGSRLIPYRAARILAGGRFFRAI